MKHRHRLLSTSAFCFLAMAMASTPAMAEFNPDEGADTSVSAVPSPSATLPSTEPLTSRVVRQPATPYSRTSATARPPIHFAPLNTSPAASVTPAPTAAVVTTPAPVVAPAAPLVVQPVVTPVLPVVEATPTPSTVKKVNFPPVDPAVMAKARQQLDAAPVPGTPVAVAAPVEVTPTPSTITETPPSKAPSNFIAPLPLATPVTPAPVVVSQDSAVPAPVVAIPAAIRPATPVVVAAPVVPVAAAPVVAVPVVPVAQAEPVVPAPEKPLSHDSKAVLSHIPSKLGTPAKPDKASKVALDRTSPKVATLDTKPGTVDAYEAAGIKISVRRPGLDTNYELNRAFNALSGGDSATAIDIYKSILSTEPENQDALFGLAAIYHRQGQIEKARPLYSKLLQVNPNHREGINNFLALVSDESPQESLAELERLEQRNPDFSPIPAQEAVVLSKLGYATESRDKMMRAIELAPDNLTYKYNLAVMLDRQGYYEQAVPIYRLLIDAAGHGEPIPAPVDTLQKRLNFIATAATAARTGVN